MGLWRLVRDLDGQHCGCIVGCKPYCASGTYINRMGNTWRPMPLATETGYQ